MYKLLAVTLLLAFAGLQEVNATHSISKRSVEALHTNLIRIIKHFLNIVNSGTTVFSDIETLVQCASDLLSDEIEERACAQDIQNDIIASAQTLVAEYIGCVSPDFQTVNEGVEALLQQRILDENIQTIEECGDENLVSCLSVYLEGLEQANENLIELISIAGLSLVHLLHTITSCSVDILHKAGMDTILWVAKAHDCVDNVDA